MIIYSKPDNLFGIKQIDKHTFKKLMYNEIHKKCRFTIPKEKIESEFDTKLNINQEQIDVIVMQELSEKQLETYLETYQDESDNFDKYTEFLLMIMYNQINPEKFKIKKKFNLLLSSISEYWEDPSNCNFTLTDKFIERRFNNLNYIGSVDTIDNAVFDANSKSEFDWASKEINYLNDIIRDNSWKEMCVSKYFIPNLPSMSKDDMIQIYKQIPTEYMKYMFISNMLCSRTHCHMVLNNFEFLQLSKNIFDKYKLVFKYLIGYSWITLKNEEYHVYHKLKDSDRIVFDFDTANLLPVYPFTFSDINQNPYASILIDKNIMNLKHNSLTFDMARNYEKYYGVCDSNEFSRRLNIFVNGSNKKGILDHIDWSCCVITGSVMTACGMKYNPLIDICKTDNNPEILTDNDLANYFFHYYQDSDVDFICNKEKILDFIDVVDKFVSNCKNVYGKTTVENIHTGTIVISDEFISKELENIRKSLNSNTIDIQYVKFNMSKQEIKDYFYDKFYIPWKKEQLERITKLSKQTNEFVQEYLKAIPREEFRIYNLTYELNEGKMVKQDYEKYFYLKDIYEVHDEENKLIAKLSESIRFKVKPTNCKTFEIFKSRDENFFSIVSRFHMGFVRALWNGKKGLCLPSYITSMMIQLAVDYKYFASIRDPIEIVNKYRSRGFGIILNDYEKLHMAYYNTVKNKNSDSNHKWIEMYNVNIKSKQSIENIFGVKKSSDDIFKPSKFFFGIPLDCFKNINHDTINTFEECFGSMITPSLTSLSKYKAINDNGKINPLAREVITLGWNLLNPQVQAQGQGQA